MTHPFSRVEKARHKLFLSYYHADDEYYRYEFESQFREYYTTKSVNLGEISSEVSDEYIKRLIRENYLADASVIVVLVGPNTKYRKHVDWEISGGLEPFSGRSGLLGILLPEFPLSPSGRYSYSSLPTRLADNARTGFAEVYTWDYIDRNPGNLVGCVNRAFEWRAREDLVSNATPQMQRNTGP